MSDIIIEDIDGNFVELNDKVDNAYIHTYIFITYYDTKHVRQPATAAGRLLNT